jgi:hypothetical protein
VAALLLLAGVAVLAPTAAQARDDDDHGEGHRFVEVVRLDELNRSDVDAKAVLVLRGTTLDVTIVAHGLEPGQVHMQHIHGLAGDTNATCPPRRSADDIANDPKEAAHPDQVISFAEGLPFYGPVLLALEPYPTASAHGNVSYHRSFTVSGDLTDLRDEVVVLHGMSLGGVYVPSLPVACGEIN